MKWEKVCSHLSGRELSKRPGMSLPSLTETGILDLGTWVLNGHLLD